MQIYSEKCFQYPIETIKAFNEKELINAILYLENLSKKYYCLGYIRYETKNIFLKKTYKSLLPLLYFEVFDKYENYTYDKNAFCVIEAKPSLRFEKYADNIKKIKEEIACGNTYEVNYTYDWNVSCNTDSLTLYNFLLKNQKTPFNAYIKNEYETILSFSPELFFELKNEHIITKPMKGTIGRGKNDIEDKANIEFLKNDIKNRAENVMIVDLLRNDLSKIAKTGTVNVSELFGIETHKTIHQMTSTIEADLKEGINLYDIFDSIFPCGSITGAPKISTMDIIDKIENGNRNVYCGAIGFLSPEKSVFSVPIRILQKTTNQSFYTYRVGGAIVWDSCAEDEWQETIQKAAFLTAVDFQIVETLKAEKGKFLYAKEHFKRMADSAQHFGFVFPDKIFDIKPQKDGIVRILLNKEGSFDIQYKALVPSKSNKIVISKQTVNSKEKFLYHKTTYRPWYTQSIAKIKSGIIYDEIFFNEKGELTEGSRTNLLLEINEKLYTPKAECGLLNGILREKYLQDGKCEEKILYLDDLKNAQRIFCINSVRGIQEVKLDTDR